LSLTDGSDWSLSETEHSLQVEPPTNYITFDEASGLFVFDMEQLLNVGYQSGETTFNITLTEITLTTQEPVNQISF
jgi:hypothetical protein